MLTLPETTAAVLLLFVTAPMDSLARPPMPYTLFITRLLVTVFPLRSTPPELIVIVPLPKELPLPALSVPPPTVVPPL